VRKFCTTDGVEWEIRVNVLAIKRVEEATSLRLTAIVDDEATRQAVLGDDLRFVDVLIALIRPQMEARQRSVESVLEAMDAATLEQAVQAIMEGVFDFFPEPRKGLLVKAWEKTRAAMEKLGAAQMAVANQRIDAIDVEGEILRFPTSHRQMPTSSASSSPASAG
jgi:hypothetical protein